MKVLFAAADPRPERWTDLIQQCLPDAEVHAWTPETQPWGADYALVWQPSPRLFEREPGLKAVFNLGAGIDGLLQVPNLPAGIPVVRLEDAGMSAQMAEYVLYHLVRLSRAMATYEQQQQAARWKAQRPITRADWPVGVLGLGQIGARVAQTLAGLDYPVAGWARSQHSLDRIDCFVGDRDLQAFLARTRVLINTLPLTPETRDMIDRNLLEALPKGAVLINVGRGEHLVEQDLIHALDEGRLDAAVLDVFRQEPLPADHPFWHHPKIAVTPHISAKTLREATVVQITDKIKKLEKGATVSGVVDLQRGY